MSFFTFKETHEPTILRRKCRELRKSTGNQELCTAFEQHDRGRTVFSVIGRSLSRPLRLFTTHPIIQVVSLLFAFNFGILFLVISTFANLWTTKYNESVATSGLNYIAWVVGELIGAQLGGILTDRVWAYLKEKANGVVTPEYRIPLMLPSIVLIPAGLLTYGWAAQFRVFWLVPDVGVAFLGGGLMIATISINGYVTDAYPDHTASATAAASFLSSVFGFVFPLFGPRLYEVLGYGWGNSVLAFVAIVLGTVGPLVLWRYGAVLRAKNKSSY